MEGLTEKQTEYYNAHVAHLSGFGIAVPTGLIYDKAKSMTDEECQAELVKHS